MTRLTPTQRLAAGLIGFASIAAACGGDSRSVAGQPSNAEVPVSTSPPEVGAQVGPETDGLATPPTGPETYLSTDGHVATYHGWTEWPFADISDEVRAELRVSSFDTDQRLVFLNVGSCVEPTDVTPGLGWGILDSSNTLLNAAYAYVSVGWLESEYSPPAPNECDEGWIGVLIDPSAEPAAVVWYDAWNDESYEWSIGNPTSATAFDPAAGVASNGSMGSAVATTAGASWTLVGIVSVGDHSDQLVPDEATFGGGSPYSAPPSATSWWLAEVEYCAPVGETAVHDGIQLAVDGWFVFSRHGRDLNIGPDHLAEPLTEPGGCVSTFESFALPDGLEPSHARLVSGENHTIWAL